MSEPFQANQYFLNIKRSDKIFIELLHPVKSMKSETGIYIELTATYFQFYSDFNERYDSKCKNFSIIQNIVVFYGQQIQIVGTKGFNQIQFLKRT